MKGLDEGENIWEHLPGMDLNLDVGDIDVCDGCWRPNMLVTSLRC